MVFTQAQALVPQHLPCSPDSEQDSANPLNRVIERAFRALPLRERSVLRLLYHRGASQGELAGAMGISRMDLRRIVRRAMARATDPMQIALLAAWRRLSPEEQRLAYLHRFLGLSLREIARHALVEGPRGDGPASPTTLRRMMRRIMRKVRPDR